MNKMIILIAIWTLSCSVGWADMFTSTYETAVSAVAAVNQRFHYDSNPNHLGCYNRKGKSGYNPITKNPQELIGLLSADPNSGECADLRGAKLAQISLSGNDDKHPINFTGANFIGADLAGVDMYNVDLSGAKFDGDDLSTTELQKCTLFETDLTKISGDYVIDCINGSTYDNTTKLPFRDDVAENRGMIKKI